MVLIFPVVLFELCCDELVGTYYNMFMQRILGLTLCMTANVIVVINNKYVSDAVFVSLCTLLLIYAPCSCCRVIFHVS